MVSSGAPLVSPSALASAAVAERAPIACFAIFRLMPLARSRLDSACTSRAGGVLDRPAPRRRGKAERIGEIDLVLEPGPQRQFAGLDHLLQVLRQLEVEGGRTVSVHPYGQNGTVHWLSLSRGRIGDSPIMS